MNSSQMDLGESGHFSTSSTGLPNQTLLDHYCTHVSLGNLDHQWKLLTRQLTRTQQFLRSLDQHPSAPTQLLSTLQLELSNIQDIYKSGESTITSATQLLNSNQLQTYACCQEKFTAFSWRCPQLAHRNCHHKRHSQHQNMNKPTHCSCRHHSTTPWSILCQSWTSPDMPHRLIDITSTTL